MFALPVILIFTILLITIQIPIICTLYYSQNYMLKMLSIKLSINMESHPLRVRGLKLSTQRSYYTGMLSHPLRVRGLKPATSTLYEQYLCRILYGCDTFLFQSVQIIIVSIYLVSSFHY